MQIMHHKVTCQLASTYTTAMLHIQQHDCLSCEVRHGLNWQSFVKLVSHCNNGGVARSSASNLTIDPDMSALFCAEALHAKSRVPVTHFISAARSGSSLLRSLLMKSHSSPANSTPVGPPPTTITLSSLSRSGEDLWHSPKEGPNENQDNFMHRQVSRTRGRGRGRGRERLHKDLCRAKSMR